MRAALLAGLLALSACASQPRVQTTIPAAMASIQSSLAQAGAVSVSHTADWTPAQSAQFERAIRAAQCSQDRQDPVIGTIAGNVTLELSGSFTQSGQFTVGAITTTPTVGVQGSASRTRTQQVSLPVAYAPLSSLPDVEMSRQIGYETELFAQNDDARHQEAARLIEDREALRERVGELIGSWDAGQCTPRAPVAPFVGSKH
ncbi:hypothetical protein NO263_07620 [Gluconacetobacter entanii]|uniref:DUF4136 domain-containing protein n=1 Tax=Gluconacetobacter entanii TaxID=108528 RepID=A0ABT3K4V8_9PROT|nr:hypothetical protein [Gluconacetobacter entanii]MCW4590445.1 hypothetical protein [Gluconacetobacter entanii]MCW4592645.1 hypothetical protein [Gluconacetobacter entanii]NPC90321.1 hypothetical protein [Gluconacetobacter entanii]